MIKKHTAFLLCSITCFSSLKAQYPDSIPDLEKPIPSFKFNTKIDNPRFPYRQMIVPTFAIVYGVSTIRSTRLTKLNVMVKEKIWMDKPHRKVRIDDYLKWTPAVAVYGLNAAGIKGKHNLLDRSVIYVMANAFTNASVFALKGITKQQRPDGSSNNSFPSGHTAIAFASAEFMRQEYKDVSVWYGVAGYAAATATGMLRMYNNKHWFSDVVAGAGIGIASTKMAYWLYPKIKNAISRNKNSNTMLMPTYQNKQAGFVFAYNFK